MMYLLSLISLNLMNFLTKYSLILLRIQFNSISTFLSDVNDELVNNECYNELAENDSNNEIEPEKKEFLKEMIKHTKNKERDRAQPAMEETKVVWGVKGKPKKSV